MEFEKTSDLNLVCRWLSEKLKHNGFKTIVSSRSFRDWQQHWHPNAHLAVELVDEMPFAHKKELVCIWAVNGDETLEHAMHRLCNHFWSEFETKFDDYTQMVSSNNEVQSLIVKTQLDDWKHVFEHISSREELELKLSIES